MAVKDLLNPKAFRRGVPTKMSVDKLIATFGVPSVGTKISYEDISQAIQCEKDTFRWGTVTSAWRKRLYAEHNVVFDSIRNEGFLVLDPNERVGWSRRKVTTGTRSIMKGADVCLATDADGLNDENKALYRHIIHIPARLKMAELTGSKDVPY